MNGTSYIVTHVNPDWDALTSAWLLRKFFPGLSHADLRFASAKAPDPELLAGAAAVVDVGLKYDIDTLRFDHHQEGFDPNTSSSKLVFEFLKTCQHAQRFPHRLEHIACWIDLVNMIDTGHRNAETQFSFSMGLHALLSSEKVRLARKCPRDEVFSRTAEWAFDMLDLLEEKLRYERTQKVDLERKEIIWSSDRRFCVGFEVSEMALFDAGAEVALVLGRPIAQPTGGLSFPITLSRAPGKKEPHMGQLVEHILEHHASEINDSTRAELQRWWRHPTGFYAGRGTAKSPCTEPICINARELGELLDRVWVRNESK
jgi:hypothetical protein